MNNLTSFFIGGAMLLFPLPFWASSYYLYYNDAEKKTETGSRIPRRTFCIDYTDNIITVPKQLLCCTLFIKDEKGTECSYFLTNEEILLPSFLVGNLEIWTVVNDETYCGIINNRE